MSLDNPWYHDTEDLANKLVEILDFQHHTSNIKKFSLEQLQNIMEKVLKSKILDQKKISTSNLIQNNIEASKIANVELTSLNSRNNGVFSFKNSGKSK